MNNWAQIEVFFHSEIISDFFSKWTIQKKKSYYSPSALAQWGHNSRKRLCRQEGEVSREYVHPWVAAGGFGGLGLHFGGQTCRPKKSPLPPSSAGAGSTCYPPVWLDGPDRSWIVALDTCVMCETTQIRHVIYCRCYEEEIYLFLKDYKKKKHIELCGEIFSL